MGRRIELYLGTPLIGDTIPTLSRNHPNLIIAGKPGAGVSRTTIKVLGLIALSEGTEVWISEGRDSGLSQEYKNAAMVWHKDHATALEVLMAEINKRIKFLQGAQFPSAEYCESTRLPTLVLVLEDVDSGDFSKHTSAVRQCLALGGAVGCHLVLTCQGVNEFSPPAEILDLISNRIVLRSWNKQSERLLGRDFASRITPNFGYAWSTTEVVPRDNAMTFWKVE